MDKEDILALYPVFLYVLGHSPVRLTRVSAVKGDAVIIHNLVDTTNYIFIKLTVAT